MNKLILTLSLLSLAGCATMGPMSPQEAQYYQNLSGFLWQAGTQERNSTPDWKVETRAPQCVPRYQGGVVVGCY